MPLPSGVIIERRIWPERPATTESRAPRSTSAFMHTPATKPAPSIATRAPGTSFFAIWRASSSVQQLSTPGRSVPGSGGGTGEEPVATSSRS